MVVQAVAVGVVDGRSDRARHHDRARNLRPCVARVAAVRAGRAHRARRLAFATIFDGDGPPPPDAQEPTGTWTGPHAAISQFTKASGALADWYRRTDADLRSLTYPHPIFGLLDGVQWLLFAASHHDNHTRDLQELREQARAATI